MERGWRSIRAELDTVLKRREEIPNYQDLDKQGTAVTEGDHWKAFFFYVFGHKIEENCARCPETTRLLAQIPGMKTAMFSILAPHKRLPEHCGAYKGVLRYHLALLIPEPK
ncbi:MAG: aspartyl/asparaginyl beta-hydroxylase domain-containing protein, partial [Terriglobia bacterium]